MAVNGYFQDKQQYLHQKHMIAPSKINTETRGRPKKEETRTLSPIYKQMFSDNSAIIHSSFLIYVFEVFVDTKNEKRVGHKDGGFTIYDKINSEYCFDNFEDSLREWGCQALLANQSMKDFVKLLPALGPKIILREICHLINFIIESEGEDQTELQILHKLIHHSYQEKLNEEYPYMRFVPRALRELKMDKNERCLFEFVRERVTHLWEYLMRIIVHTIINCAQGRSNNKYFKPFFSDAQNSSETYIGQLNLDQVVMAVRKLENQDRSNRGSEANIDDENIDKLRKVRSIVDNEGTRTVVQIIKAPESLGGISLGIQRKNTQNLGLMLESPAKITRLQSEPSFHVGGFSTVFKPKVVGRQIQSDFILNPDENDRLFNSISDLKIPRLDQDHKKEQTKLVYKSEQKQNQSELNGATMKKQQQQGWQDESVQNSSMKEEQQNGQVHDDVQDFLQ